MDRPGSVRPVDIVHLIFFSLNYLDHYANFDVNVQRENKFVERTESQVQDAMSIYRSDRRTLTEPTLWSTGHAVRECIT